jgi:RimJ/RimL family protein N-acetyltransferase
VAAAWFQDAAFLRLAESDPLHPHTEAEIRAWISKAHESPDEYSFPVRTTADDTLIGLVELEGIEWHNRCAEIGIGIGNPAYQGQGYGAEAMRLTLRFAFDDLNLHRIYLLVFAYNTPAIKLYERLGFTLEGTMRQHVERAGMRYDQLLYGLLRPEWLVRR